MADALAHLWPHFDEANPMFSEGTVRTWPDGAIDRLRSSGILHEAELAAFVSCPSCPDGHTEEVILLEQPDGATCAYIPCPVNMRVSVADDLRRQWTINWGRFVELLAVAVGATGVHKPVVSGVLWRLGKVGWQSGKREALFARSLHAVGSVDITERISRFGSSILFVANESPPVVTRSARYPAVVALSSIATFGAAGIELDLIALASVVVEADLAARQAEAEALDHRNLKDLVRQEVRTQRADALTDDAIVAAYKVHGTSRATEDALRAVGFEIDHSTIARKVKAAKETGQLLDGRSSDSVQRIVASQPRDRKRKFASPTQPPGDQ